MAAGCGVDRRPDTPAGPNLGLGGGGPQDAIDGPDPVGVGDFLGGEATTGVEPGQHAVAHAEDGEDGEARVGLDEDSGSYPILDGTAEQVLVVGRLGEIVSVLGLVEDLALAQEDGTSLRNSRAVRT